MQFRPLGIPEEGRTLDLALTAQRAIVPLVRRVQRHDRKLAQQLKDTTNSFVLNLGDAI